MPSSTAPAASAPPTTPPPEDMGAVAGGRMYFPHLDGLRFWAFLVVFFWHGLETHSIIVGATPAYKSLRHWAISGVLGVNFFFVLSGFLITYLLLAEHQKTGRIDVKGFYVRRALRIWPLYFACVGVAYLLRPGFPTGAQLPPLSYYLSFRANFALIDVTALPPDHAWNIGLLIILWSVAVEEQFYLVWPLLIGAALSAFASRGRSRTLDGSTLKPAATARQSALLLLALAGTCALTLAFRVWHRHEYAVLHYHTLAVIGDMALGGWAAWTCYSSSRWVERIANLSRRDIVAGYVALVLCVLVYGHALALQVLEGHPWVGLRWADALSRPILAALFAFVIVEQCYAKNSFYKCGRSPLLSRLGTYTYGLYCLHIFAIVIAQKVALELGWDKALWQILLMQIPLAFVISLVLAVLSYHFFETPFLRLKRRFAHVQTT